MWAPFCEQIYFTTSHSIFLFFFLIWSLPPTHCRCRGLLLHLITFTLTHTQGRTPLNDWSALHRDLCLAIQRSQVTDLHFTVGIRTRNLSKRPAADPSLRPRGHRNRLKFFNLPGIFSDIKHVSNPCGNKYNLIVTFLTCVYWLAYHLLKILAIFLVSVYCEYCW